MNSQNNDKTPIGEMLKGYRPHILVVIVDRNQSERVVHILREKEVHIHFTYICMAEGTASSEIMNMLGLGSIDKAVVLCLIPGFYLPLLLNIINQELNLQKAKKGIAFTIPLSGVSSTFLQVVEKVKEEWIQNLEPNKYVSIDPSISALMNGQMGDEPNMNIHHDLIVAVINQGYSDDLMEAAKKAGATGGTVIHARRIGIDDTTSFFGIAIQAEKEVVAILTTRENKHDIMQAVSQSSGLKTDARGIIFSLPVDGVAGLESGKDA